MASAVNALYTGELRMNGVSVELLGRADSAQPTFVNCRAFRVLLWTGVKTGNAPIQYTVRGGDQHGWQWTHTGAITTGANQWFRVAIRMPRRTAWLRIELSGATQTLRSKIVGVRG
ncbi:MAG: hypothetical protein NZ556_08150 [Fimbriimonadales bacterium]|nr:hypothetical protein [Fimbriimonadales bacterium]